MQEFVCARVCVCKSCDLVLSVQSLCVQEFVCARVVVGFVYVGVCLCARVECAGVSVCKS